MKVHKMSLVMMYNSVKHSKKDNLLKLTKEK